ncbi:hypothetical protein EsH8_III_000065 [Colletotrichum jinshuiense]
MRATALITLFLGIALAAPTTGDTDKPYPPADQVKIVDVNYGGSGCPKNTVTDILSDKRDLVTLLFDDYIAESGPNINPTKNRAACQINIKMHFPQGWQLSVFQADYRGHVDLPKGVEGYCKATYYFSGDSNSLSRSLKFNGPVVEDYTKTDVFGLESVVWSACGEEAMLNVKSAIEIRPLGTEKYALMTVDSTDYKVAHLYHIQWRRCKKN